MPLIKAHTSIIGETGYNCHARNFFMSLNKLAPVEVRNWTIGSTWKGYNNDEPHNDEYYINAVLKRMLSYQTLSTLTGSANFPLYRKYKQVDEFPTVNIVLNDNKHPYFTEKYDSPSIAYNVWETTIQPTSFFENLKKFDQVWVPSEWQKQCTIDQGIPANKVKIVPEGVDIKMFKPRPEVAKTNRTNPFRFIIVGRWEYRKSTREMIQSFIDTFGEDENVELVINVDNPFATDGCKSTEDRLTKFGLNHKNIKVRHHLNKSQYVDLLHSADVFISCSRSEGWNLPLIEAMACGIPSLYSNWGAQLQFAQDKGIPINIIGEVSASVNNDESWDSSSPGNFAEPDFEDLKLKMREVFTNYEKYESKALLDSEIIRNIFTWDNAAQIAYDHIQELLNPVTTDNSSDFAWVTCGNLGYMPLIEKFVKSLLEFSNHKVIVYGINCEVPFSYDNVISRRLDIPGYSIHDKWYWKQHACIAAIDEGFANYVWMDGDVIVNYNVDNIQEYFGLITNYPIPDRHLPEDFVNFEYDENGNQTVQRFNENLHKKYGFNRVSTIAHICMYVYNANCKWWFEEMLAMYKNTPLTEYSKLFTWNDEGIDNFLRDKHKFHEILPITNFDVSEWDGDIVEVNGKSLQQFIEFWQKDGPNNFGKIYGWQFVPQNRSQILYFHGNKNLEFAEFMLEFIKMQRDNSFYDSHYFYTDKDVVKNLGKIAGISGGTIEIANQYGWDHAIYHEIYNLKDYEYLDKVKVKPGDIVVDLGGNLGIFTRFAYQCGASKIITFEPDRRYFEILQKNSPDNVILFNAAIGDKLGKITLSESTHLGGSTVLYKDNLQYTQYPVNVYTLNHILDNGLIDHIDFLKIDIEGSEILALQGISDEHLSNIRNIAMEYHHAALNRNDDLRHNFITRLTNLGFNSYLLFLGTDSALQMIYFWK